MKDSFIIEGKKYISSRRASEISDYASDYIGQLCRAEKLDCRMIGRTWFVTEESIHLHQATVLHDEVSRNRIENLRGRKTNPAHPVSPSVSQIESVGMADNSPVAEVSARETVAAPLVVMTRSLAIVAVDKFSENKISYLSDDRPLLPVLKKPDETAVTSNVLADVRTVVASGPNASEIGDGHPKSNLPVASYPELVRSIILRRALAAVIVLTLVVSLDGASFNLIGRGARVISGKLGSDMAINSESSPATIYDALRAAGDIIRRGYEETMALIRRPAQLSMNTGDAGSEPMRVNGVFEGMVVVPSEGATASDDAMKQKIKDSFSDPVEVRADKSGTTGVIKPIFKSSKGNDFVYVMVPIVKDESGVPKVYSSNEFGP